MIDFIIIYVAIMVLWGIVSLFMPREIYPDKEYEDPSPKPEMFPRPNLEEQDRVLASMYEDTLRPFNTQEDLKYYLEQWESYLRKHGISEYDAAGRLAELVLKGRDNV